MTARDHATRDAIAAALTDPRDVARRLGLDALPQARGGVLVRCPAHGDKDASCSLTRGPRDGLLRVRCFGCGMGGDVFTLIAAVNSLDPRRDFAEVVRAGAELAAIALPDLAAAPEAAPSIGDDAFAALASRLVALSPLRRAPDVAAYLERRRILAQAHGDGWGALPRGGAQDAIVRELVGDFGRAAVLGSGLVVADDRARPGLRFVRPGARVLIPWRDAAGRVVGLQRRRIDDGEPRYVSSLGRPLRTPYGLDRVTPSGPLAFVEGAVDVLALRELAARRRFAVCVLGLPGVEGWRATWAQFAAGRRAYVALDHDDAGEAHAEAIAADLRNAGADPLRWRPRAKDWAKDLENWSAGMAARKER